MPAASARTMNAGGAPARDAFASRMQRSGSARLLGVFAAFVVLAATVLGANPARETSTPFDLLIGQRAWSWIDPDVAVRHKERSDILNALVPNWTSAREQLRAGRLPLWTDVSGGTSLVTPVHSTYTPAFVLFALAPDPALGFLLGVIFNLAVAGSGTYLLLRRHTGRLAAAVGGLSFQLCGFNAAWLYWPHVMTIIWLPWLLLAIEACARRPGLRGALGVAAATALTALGGFPFLSVLVLEAGALYALLAWLAGKRPATPRRPFPAWYAAGTLLGLALCALPLLELVAWIDQFDLGYREGRGSYLGPEHANRLLPPWAYQHKRVEQTMYIGLPLLLMSVVSVAWPIARRERPPAFQLFSIALLAISAGLVFELWPMWLVGWLPGMSNNSWSRAIGLMDFSLVALGAIGFDRLAGAARRRPGPIAHAAVIAIAVVQSVEIAQFFRRYNGAVGREYYFPEVPAIRYMREHAGPFDFVIADGSFRSSGTLGAYGLREWYAHAFHRDELKALLKRMVRKPFISRTAARIDARRIRGNDPWHAALNVRYLAVASDDPYAIRARSDRSKVALPALPAHRWQQEFTIRDRVSLAGISLRMATYHRDDLRGVLRLHLLSDDGTRLATSSVDAQYTSDNDMEDFYFDRPVMLAPSRYRFEVAYEPEAGPAPGPITAWASRTRDENAALLVDGEPFGAIIDFQLHPHRSRYPSFRRVLTAADISVYENTRAPRGPYYIRDIDDFPDADSGREVTVEAYRPDRFTLRYEGTAPGYIVVPMNAADQWSVLVDGAPARYRVKQGVLPAVPVAGQAVIRFDYRPASARWLHPWALLLASGLAVLAFLDRRARRSRRVEPDHANAGTSA